MAEPFDASLPTVGQKPWSLNPAITEVRGRLGGVEDFINGPGLEEKLVETAAELNPEALSDTFIATQIDAPESETNSALTAKTAQAMPWVNVQDFGAKGDGTTNDTAAINAALDAAEGGAAVVFPFNAFGFGKYISDGGHVVPEGVTILGFGAGRQLFVDGAPVGSAVICSPSATPDAMFTFSGAGVTFKAIQINGMDRAATVLKGSGFQHRIDDCDIRRGSAYGIHITHDLNGHENKIVDTDVTMNSMGVGIRYEGSATEPSHDNTIVNTTVRGAPRSVEIIRSSANQFVGCHFYSYPAVSIDCLVYIDNGTLNQFVGCYFDGVRGPAVKLYAETGAIDQTQFVGCLFPSFVSTLTHNTVPVIEVKHTTYGVSNTVLSGNTVSGPTLSRQYSFFYYSIDGGGDPRGLVLTGNNLRNVVNLVNPPAAVQSGNVLNGKPLGTIMRTTDEFDTALQVQRAGEAFSRLLVNGNGVIALGPGSVTRDVSLQRTAAKVLSLGADNLFRSGAFATSARPAATAVGQGAQYFDTTLNKPIWSDGGTWRDATGAVV